MFSDANLTLGADVSGANVSTGYVDELRLTTNMIRYTAGATNIAIPSAPFPNSEQDDPYFDSKFTQVLWSFNNFRNEATPDITFTSINSQKLLSDVSWETKKVELVGYGNTLQVDSTLLNTNAAPGTSQIFAVKLNQE